MARLQLLPDWRRIVRKAWSIRLVVLSGLLAGAEVALPLFVDAMPRNIFALLSMAAAIGGAVARVIDQPKMERRVSPRTPGSEADYD